MRVALFVTCVADQLFPDTAMATVRLLESAGVNVEFPIAQTCCGQPAYSAGAPHAAARLAAHHLDVFSQYDAIVAPSGSCAAHTRLHFAELLPHRRADVDALADRTFEITQYLVDVLGIDDIGARVRDTVTVHDSCHGLRGLRIADAPRRLLRSAGATIVEMTEPDTCCGFGGVFSLQYPEVANRLADAKLGHALDTQARWLVSTDLACLMHLERRRVPTVGTRRRVYRAAASQLLGRSRARGRPGPEPVHVAELLASGLPA